MSSAMEWVGNYHPKDSGPEVDKWAMQFTRGEPKATAKFTAEQLKAMGFVGLYRQKEIA